MYGPGDVGFFDRITPLYDLFMPATDPEPIRRGLGAADRDVDRLVDLGGGTGRGAQALDGPGDPTERLVVDVSLGMLREARADGLPAVAGDARRLPLRTGSIDAILIVDAYHHMPDREAVFRECQRVLAPGGVVIVRDFDPGTVRGRLLVLAERVTGLGSRFERPDSVAADASEAGFSARVLDRGFTYTVVARASGG
jgi:demethylmenaquinone methyltransferase/2-methoxy-6-polyprenyl-1,4-benzoquinol methylase